MNQTTFKNEKGTYTAIKVPNNAQNFQVVKGHTKQKWIINYFSSKNNFSIYFGDKPTLLGTMQQFGILKIIIAIT